MPHRPSPLTAASLRRRGVTVVGAVVALGAATAALSLAPSTAGASEHHRAHVHGHHHGHHRGGLPVVSHAKDLSTEPAVHRGKGRPPKNLLTRDLVKGTGAPVTLSSTVVVKYVGANYTTGKDFTQQTWQSGQPAAFPLSGVVPGFAEGLVGMKVGGRREIVIPPRLGYRNRSTGPIKANETLVFVVDLVSLRS